MKNKINELKKGLGMKNKIVLVILIAIAVWFSNRQSTMDILMEVDSPIVATEKSGIQYYEPESGSTVHIEDQIEKGLINIVYFHNSKCKSCLIFATNLDKLIQVRPDVAITRLPVEKIIYKPRYMNKKLNVRGLPFVMIFDRAGKLLIADNGDEHKGYKTFYKWINKEVNRKR